MSEQEIKYYEYKLEANLLCIRERMKKGNYCPCVKTIPFSTITGALKEAYFKRDDPVYAAGYLTKVHRQDINTLEDVQNIEPQILVLSPQDKITGEPRKGIAPIRIEYLEDVEARVFIVANDTVRKTFDDHEEPLIINVGAFLSKGMGRCILTDKKTHAEIKNKKGRLLTRIPIDYLDKFKINTEDNKGAEYKSKFCYLYEPDQDNQFKPNHYLLSLLEGSEVEGLEYLICTGGKNEQSISK